LVEKIREMKMIADPQELWAWSCNDTPNSAGYVMDQRMQKPKKWRGRGEKPRIFWEGWGEVAVLLT